MTKMNNLWREKVKNVFILLFLSFFIMSPSVSKTQSKTFMKDDYEGVWNIERPGSHGIQTLWIRKMDDQSIEMDVRINGRIFKRLFGSFVNMSSSHTYNGDNNGINGNWSMNTDGKYYPAFYISAVRGPGQGETILNFSLRGPQNSGPPEYTLGAFRFIKSE